MEQFSKLLYKNSPFLPTIDSDFHQIVQDTVLKGYVHPAIAIADMVRQVCVFHTEDLAGDEEWLAEKFSITDYGLADYIFGLMIPPSILIIKDSLKNESSETAFTEVFNINGDRFQEIVKYTSSILPKAKFQISWKNPHPLAYGRPIYNLCRVEVFSLNPWYTVGLEASWRLYMDFSQILVDEIAKGTPL